MDARKSAAAMVFLVGLSLSFGYLKVQATTSNCSVTRMVTSWDIMADTESLQIPCFNGPVPVPNSDWTIGSDICNISGFVPYEPCPSSFSCTVHSSDFLQRGPTFVCCQTECFEFKINPVVNSITVPPVIQAGKEATVYTTVAAKPLPPDIPSLIVKVRQPNEVNSTEIDTAAQIIPSPTNRTEYIILHKFVVPVNVEEMTVAAPRFDLPENWTSTGDISFEPIGVVVIPDVEPPTTTDIATDLELATTTPPATDSDTTATTTPVPTDDTNDVNTPTGPMTGGLSPDSTCIAAGHLAAAVVISMAVPVIIFTALVCVFCFSYKKRRDPEKSYSSREMTETSKKVPHHQINGFIHTPPTSLSIPSTLATQNSTTPTPTPGFGETPLVIDERAGLLGSSSRNRAAPATSPHIIGVVNHGYNRIPSSDSTSPTTPGETRQPLSVRDSSGEPSAAAAASTNNRIDAPGTSLGPNSGTESDSSDSGARVSSKQWDCGQHVATSDEQEKRHIYEEVKKPGYVPPSQRPLPDIPNSQQETHSELTTHNFTKPYHIDGFDKRQQICKSNKFFMIPDFISSNPPLITESEADVDDPTDIIYRGVDDGETINLPPQSGPEVASV